jgi:squalene-hopene/tetraprenyl-beta-curcumene cyclase
MIDKEQLKVQFNTLADLLIKQQNSGGFWTGRLSSSALATAVAVVAVKINGAEDFAEKVSNGLLWLFNHVNRDGGFGDTPESQSNVSTSLLCYAAISFCSGESDTGKSALKGIAEYLLSQKISLIPENIISSVLKFYGRDYTFSVPILSMLVICGVIDESGCRNIPQLPFELVLLPSSWYSFFNLGVVSYAFPALIAMGIFIFKKRKHHNPIISLIRNNAIKPSLRKLARIVPESGGFLEATPLTAFVSMCLISGGFANNRVVEKGIEFLNNQQREDGSWPIDTDLSTWVTTLAVKALGNDKYLIPKQYQAEHLRKHLLTIQFKEKHPFNNAGPGGWGWTNFSGSVPDVDDTCGAILALLELYSGSEEETHSVINGCKWLISIQNNDGGFPTFCKGWGRLPFDSSCSDLTGHAFCALMTTLEKTGNKIPQNLRTAFYRSALKGLKYLNREQHESGYWLPLWFGNQFTHDKTNPVYGTARVYVYLSDCLIYKCLNDKIKVEIEHLLTNAGKFLLHQQNDDGSWGGERGVKGSVEETSLAICALSKGFEENCLRGFQWLDNIYKNEGLPSSPIGLYFAALWYDEKLYPLIYYIESLRRYL